MKKHFIAYTLIVAGFIVFSFSGCSTVAPPPAAGPVGFPLIDIVDAEVEIADESQFAAKEEVQWNRSTNTKIIGGSLGIKIVPKDITITLIETAIQVPIRNKADITSWFLNIPRGLKATAHALDPKAKYAAEKGATTVIATIEGIPLQPINQPIKIRVPWEVTNRSWDFDIPMDRDRRFEVYGVDVGSVIVGGAVNRPIDAKTFRIGFGGTKLAKGIDQGTDISHWFTNLPRGLKAVVSEDTVPISEDEDAAQNETQYQYVDLSVDSTGDQDPDTPNQQFLQVTISGTPTVQLKERIRISIPADITTANIAMVIRPSDKARYDIGSYSSVAAEDIELRTGSNWRGVQEGWGLVGPEVFKSKDFTPLGIIQLQSESVYQMGADGEYHWTGDYITYGELMAEAKKLNAHAIIDVVLDYNDQVNEIIERRHIADGHEPSPLERSKLEKGLITEEDDPNGGKIYVEKISVTNRTWTGTALAIQYAPAYPPSGEIYVPAYPDPELAKLQAESQANSKR
ncbi:hypothetical protein LQZ21_05415 [Treponema sp. TIM-1]|uniref:hypothetical protein n=1 Tax=Treponema sp. TIM-1 TaxID=2898417 RepID=UPI00397FAF6A